MSKGTTKIRLSDDEVEALGAAVDLAITVMEHAEGVGFRSEEGYQVLCALRDLSSAKGNIRKVVVTLSL